MAKLIGSLGYSPRRALVFVAFAVPLAIASFFVLDASTDDSRRSDTYGSGVSEQCVEDTARIADERANAAEELGANAPITGFWFAESCFE